MALEDFTLYVDVDFFLPDVQIVVRDENPWIYVDRPIVWGVSNRIV